MWIVYSLPLLLLMVVTWTLAGFIILRFSLRQNSGLTIATLSLPTGMIVYGLLVNIFSYIVPVHIASWFILVGALICAIYYLRRLVQLEPITWEIPVRTRWILLTSILILTGLLLYINIREIWVDDLGHAPMIHLLASDQFPLLYHCNVDLRAAYNYGGDLLSASVVQTAGVLPWNAIDIVKVAATISVAMMAYFAGWNRLKDNAKGAVWAGILSVFLLFTIGPMLWILLPLSQGGAALSLANSSDLSTLIKALQELTSSLWQYTVKPPGFITSNLGHSHRSISWVFSPFSILLFWNFFEIQLSYWRRTIVLGIVLAATALFHTAALFILIPGLLVYIVLQTFRLRQFPRLPLNPFVVLLIFAILSILQGGIITDGLLDRLSGQIQLNPTTEFHFRFPPYWLPSCDGQQPSLTCLLLSIGNLGVAPLILPLIAFYAYRKRFMAWTIIIVGCTVAYLVPFFVSYGYINWNIYRLFTFASWMIAVMLGPLLYILFTRYGLTGKILVIILIFLTSYTGVIEDAMMIDGRYIGKEDSLSINFSSMVPDIDMEMMKYEPYIPKDAIIFDPSGCGGSTTARPGYLFGRYSRSATTRNLGAPPTTGFTAMLENPSSDNALKFGYSHLYFDKAWYETLGKDSQEHLQNGNYEVLKSIKTETDFRVLLRVCQTNQVCSPKLDYILK